MRVVAPARLHFGLFRAGGTPGDTWPAFEGLPPLPRRRFGGIGLMIDRPATIVEAIPAGEWSYSDRRMADFAERYLASLPEVPADRWALSLREAPPSHAGLGSGTQLAMATGRLLERLLGRAPETPRDLARRVGRGDRSGIGIEGSSAGGLLVDGGKVGGEVAPVVARAGLPPEWRVILVFPDVKERWCGGRERQAFAALADSPDREEGLARLALLGILPAAASGDFGGFSAAVHEFNARVGDRFAPVQGGRYAHPKVAEAVAGLLELGVTGCGQSSWGPAVFGFCEDDERAEAVRRKLDWAATVTVPTGGPSTTNPCDPSDL